MTTTSGQQTTWLTQEAYDRLSAELEEAKGPRRADIVAKIEAARDEGDLKENGGYHAAREELGKIDGRIQQLVDMLQRAKVGETPPDDGVVEPGMKVTVELAGPRWKDFDWTALPGLAAAAVAYRKGVPDLACVAAAVLITALLRLAAHPG